MSDESDKARKPFVGVQMDLNEWTVDGRTYRNWKFQRVGEKKEVTTGDDTAKSVEKVEVKCKKDKKKPKKSESERSVEVESPLVKKKDLRVPVKMPSEVNVGIQSPLFRITKQKRIEMEEERERQIEKRLAARSSKKVKLVELEASDVSVRRRSPMARISKQRRVEMEEEWERQEEMKLKSARKNKDKLKDTGAIPKRESSECDVDKSLKMAFEEKTKTMSMEQLTKMCYDLQRQINAMKMRMLSDGERLHASKNQAVINTAKKLGEILTVICTAVDTVMDLAGEEELPNAKENISKLQAFINAIAK